jgi:hypothetical protein
VSSAEIDWNSLISPGRGPRTGNGNESAIITEANLDGNLAVIITATYNNKYQLFYLSLSSGTTIILIVVQLADPSAELTITAESIAFLQGKSVVNTKSSEFRENKLKWGTIIEEFATVVRPLSQAGRANRKKQ